MKQSKPGKVPLSALAKRMGYAFRNEQLLIVALSHRSVYGENYERLEFLGDAILNLVVTDEIYRRFPQASEGVLSRMRAKLVKGETLAEVARTVLHLGDYLRLGSGELKSGGFRRASILADAVEAIIAAIYLDADLMTCQRCILNWLSTALDEISDNSLEKDNKTALQEYLQGQHKALPQYAITKTEGEAHEQIFYVCCCLPDMSIEAEASGTNRRQAEQKAAGLILQKLVNKKI